MTNKLWPRTRLKNLVESVQTGVWGADPTGDGDDVLCVRVADFDRQRLGLKSVDTVRSVPEADRTTRLLRAGDILLEKSGGTEANPVGFTVLFEGEYPAVSSNFIGRVRMRDGQHPRFWLYALAASYLTHRTQKCVRQTTGIQNLDHGAFFNEIFAVPARGEQYAIADYLDRETVRIDTLIEEQLRLIELLRERRSAMITHAVTRGLDGSPLTDSGNMYLGEVPIDWTVGRFSREMSVNGGQVDPREDPWADMILVAPNHIESGTGRLVGRETAREQGADSGKYLARAGQILYSKIRPALNKVTLAAEDCLTSADMYAMSSRRGDDHRYLMYFMLAHPFHAFATLTSLRVKMPKINRDELGEAPVLCPSVEEQQRIAACLDEQTAKIDGLIAETERFIELARERRAALITAAVTGQIDVRESA